MCFDVWVETCLGEEGIGGSGGRGTWPLASAAVRRGERVGVGAVAVGVQRETADEVAESERERVCLDSMGGACKGEKVLKELVEGVKGSEGIEYGEAQSMSELTESGMLTVQVMVEEVSRCWVVSRGAVGTVIEG